MTTDSSGEWCARLLAAEPGLPSALAAVAGAGARFAVHRQSVRGRLLEALRGAFPALEQALGADYFAALAAQFIEAAPPRTPVMHEYGAEFPAYVDAFPTLHEWPWLADLARLEWARREVFHAADTLSIPAEVLQQLPVEALLHASYRLQPAWRLVASSFPLDRLWLAQQVDATPLDQGLVWQPVTVQVWRVGFSLRQRALADGEAVLRERLAQGQTLLEALQFARTSAPDFDARAAIRALIDDALIVAIHSHQSFQARS